MLFGDKKDSNRFNDRFIEQIGQETQDLAHAMSNILGALHDISVKRHPNDINKQILQFNELSHVVIRELLRNTDTISKHWQDVKIIKVPNIKDSDLV